MDFQTEMEQIKDRLGHSVLELEKIKNISEDILKEDQPQQLNVVFFLKNYYRVVCEFIFNNKDILLEETANTKNPTNFIREWTAFAKSRFGSVELIERKGSEIKHVITLPGLFTSPEMYRKNIGHFYDNITEYNRHIENGYRDRSEGFFKANVMPTLKSIENKALENRLKWINALKYLRSKYNIIDNYDEFFKEVSVDDDKKETKDNLESAEDLGFC